MSVSRSWRFLPFLPFLPAGLSCLCMIACATAPSGARSGSSGVAPMRTVPPAHLAQQGFGGQAHFAYCLPPDCPRPTRKFYGAPVAVVAVGPPQPPMPTTIRFAHGQSRLDASAQRTLEQAGDAFADASRITVTGFTDATGTQPANDRIALARARSVADFLQARQFTPTGQIETQGRGRCCYLDGNQTPQGRARNRRVEIAIVPSPTRSTAP